MSAIVRKIKSKDEYEILKNKVKNDNHSLLSPSYGVYKNGKVIGVCSYKALPLVEIWLDPEDCKPRDTLEFMRQMEAIIDADGAPGYVMPILTNSPGTPFFEKLGYKQLIDHNLWYRLLR
tara:strand:+ start:1189 stop:1548 length:360 start_codon:yes stop_codon:yes gene_type:complete